jgi:hypothetical protein
MAVVRYLVNDVDVALECEQILGNDPSGNPVELFESSGQ